MASYGKIATGQKRTLDIQSNLKDRSDIIDYQAESSNLSQDFGLGQQVLNALTPMAASMDENRESYENLSTGATEAGVKGIADWKELGFGERAKISLGFGITSGSETIIEDLDATYSGYGGMDKENKPISQDYSTSSLMEIGRKSRAGTLKPSLIGAENEKLNIWDLYGEGAGATSSSGTLSSGTLSSSSTPPGTSGTGQGAPSKKERKGFDWTSVGIGDGESPLLEAGGKLLGAAGEHLGMLDQEGLFRRSNRNKTGIFMGSQHGAEKSGSPYHLSNLWDTLKQGDYIGKKGFGQ